jgi:hypothetical protein
MEAQTIGSIAVIRSLGQAGYPVHACSSNPDALGFKSKFALYVAISPSYYDREYREWLGRYIQENRIKAIIPSESALIAIRSDFNELSQLLPFNRSEAVVYAGLSKFDLFQRCLSEPSGNTSLPPTILISDTADIPSEERLRALGLPLFVKSDGVYASGNWGGGTYKCNNVRTCQETLDSLAPRFKRLIVQGGVPGQGVGVFFCIWEGKIIAEFMHRRLHEVPHTGGASSFRESWWHSNIRDDALSKLRLAKWQGVAMLEYRWDATSDRFYLMEMNGRFWGSLHLMLYAGVDFPRLLLDCFHGRNPQPVHKFPLGLRCRYTFPRDVQYVWSCLKDNELNRRRRIWAVFEFFQLTLNYNVYSDLWFPGDRGLYWRAFKNFLTSLKK